MTLMSQSVLGQVVDLITPSVVVTGTVQDLDVGSWPWSGMSDEDGSSRFVAYNAQ